jgi:hypothetical protein
MDRCRVERPNLQTAQQSQVACHLFGMSTVEASAGE